MAARKDDTGPFKSIYCPKRPYKTIIGPYKTKIRPYKIIIGPYKTIIRPYKTMISRKKATHGREMRQETHLAMMMSL